MDPPLGGTANAFCFDETEKILSIFDIFGKKKVNSVRVLVFDYRGIYFIFYNLGPNNKGFQNLVKKTCKDLWKLEAAFD